MSDAYSSTTAPIDSLPSIGSGAQPQQPGQPMNILPQQQDPNSGAGWKQGLVNGIRAVGNAAGKMQVQNGQLGAVPQPGQSQQAQQMLQRAQALLKQGVISPAQYAQMTGQPLPPGATDQVAPPAAPVAPPTGVAAPAYQPPSPTGPTSSAWGS